MSYIKYIWRGPTANRLDRHAVGLQEAEVKERFQSIVGGFAWRRTAAATTTPVPRPMIIGNFSVTDFNQLPSLGSGMGFRLPLAKQILAAQESLDFLEITADHFMEMSRQREKLLDQLKSQYTLIPHGLSLSLGSAEGLNSGYLRQLTDLVERVNPPWWSEHISFSKAGGVEIGHLSPVPFNGSGLKALCENIRIATESIARPLILENITYTMALPWNEIDEAEFLSELLDRTGSGLLLDVTNLYTNSENHKYDAVAFWTTFQRWVGNSIMWEGNSERARSSTTIHATRNHVGITGRSI